MQFFYFSFLEVYQTEGVQALLIAKNERLLSYFIPQLIIFRAMRHLNKVINDKFEDNCNNKENKENKNNLFDGVDDKNLHFEKLSANSQTFWSTIEDSQIHQIYQIA